MPRAMRGKLCVVETPADQAALERTGSYRGLYFVLMGRLSPLDGVGVHDIGVAELLERASDPAVQEVILALGFSAEGEATAHALGQALRGARLHCHAAGARRAGGQRTGVRRPVDDRPRDERPPLSRDARGMRHVSACVRPSLPAVTLTAPAARVRGLAAVALRAGAALTARAGTNTTTLLPAVNRVAVPTLFHCATCAVLTR